MKITMNRELLESKFSAITAAMPNKSIVPIYDYALAEVSEEKITFTGSDGEIAISTSMSAEIEGEVFDFVFDIRTILKTISLMKYEAISFDVSEDKIEFTAVGTRKKFEVPITDNPDMFPRMESSDYKDVLRLNGEVLSKIIKKACPIINHENIRTAFRGVHVVKREDSIVFESGIDSILCYVSVQPEVDPGDFPEILIPKNIMKIIQSYEKSNDVELAITEDNRNLRIKDGIYTTYMRLLDDKFPDTTPFIGSYQPITNVEFNKDALQMAIKRTGIYSDHQFNAVILDMREDNEVKLYCDNKDFRKRAEEILDVAKKDSKMNFVTAFNQNYLTNFLNNLSGETILFSQLKYDQVAFFTDSSSEGFTTIWLTMGVMVQDVKNQKKVEETELS